MTLRRRSVLLVSALTFAVAACANTSATRQEGGLPSRVPVTPSKAATGAEKKISSQLLQEIYRAEGRAVDRGRPSVLVRVDADRRALVDIRASMTPVLQAKLDGLKATVVSNFPQVQSIVAWVPLVELLALAADDGITSIMPAQQAATHSLPANPVSPVRP